MPSASLCVPPFSPVLLGGLLLQPLPLAPLNIFLSAIFQQMHRRHRDVFERLAAIDSPNFLINPVDLPFFFILDANPTKPILKAIDTMPSTPAATISGPLAMLVSLLEGEIDGDALFFSRTLTISGDTEAVVALRNAIDGSEIDVVQEIAAMSGPFSILSARILQYIKQVWQSYDADLGLVARSLTAQQTQRLNAQQGHIEQLQQQVHKLAKQIARKETAKAS